jgi:hypothetical protein
MSLYNFQPRFVHLIKSGEKRHTIRSIRKHPNKPGDILHLYVGLRHPGAKLIRRVRCTKIEIIEMRRDQIGISVAIENRKLKDAEKETLAIRDGFSCFEEMIQFWIEPINRLPFVGHVIHWDFL